MYGKKARKTYPKVEKKHKDIFGKIISNYYFVEKKDKGYVAIKLSDEEVTEENISLEVMSKEFHLGIRTIKNQSLYDFTNYKLHQKDNSGIRNLTATIKNIEKQLIYRKKESWKPGIVIRKITEKEYDKKDGKGIIDLVSAHFCIYKNKDN